MFCTNCGAQMPEGTKFCTVCGSPLASRPEATGDSAGPVDAAATRVMDDPTERIEPEATAPAVAQEPIAPESPAPGQAASHGPDPKGDAGRNGLAIAAAVAAGVALVALVAFVVVIVDPFNLNILGGDAAAPADDAAITQTDEEEPAEEPAEPEAALQAIAVEAGPNKTQYGVGEALDPSGLILRLTYDDGTEKTVAYASENAGEFSFSPSTLDVAGGANVTVTYGGCQATFAVSAAAPEPEPEVEYVEVPVATPAPSSSGTYVLPDSSYRLYSYGELTGLSTWQLYIARNEIYARHGRTFYKDDLQNYFDGQSWYTPIYGPEEFDSLGLLNSTEQQNAATILTVEQDRGSQYI